MDYYVFKLNLEPTILNLYKNEVTKLISTVVPNAFDISFVRVDTKGHLIKYRTATLDKSEITNSNVYKELHAVYKKFYGMFFQVLQKFKTEGEINYSTEYLSTRDYLNNNIKILFTEYPILQLKVESMKNVLPIDQYSKVKMGATFLQRAAKIFNYVEQEDETKKSSIEFIYNSSNEKIYFKKDLQSTIIDIPTAYTHAITISDILNENKKTNNIGFATINPVFDNINLEGLYSEITVEIVYPNGSTSLDRSQAIEDINAAKEIRKFVAPTNSKINSSNVNSLINENAKKGYLSSVTSRSRSIIKGALKTVSGIW